MSREPRLSAASLCAGIGGFGGPMRQFNSVERGYLEKQLQHQNSLLTSSMGRFLDAIASILGLVQFNSFDGEAAMKLEALAERSGDKSFESYDLHYTADCIEWEDMLRQLLADLAQDVPPARIAYKVFVSLAYCIKLVAQTTGVIRVACSGGVFQNALLVDLLHSIMAEDHILYFHVHLSCNDECIGFGQLAACQIQANHNIVGRRHYSVY